MKITTIAAALILYARSGLAMPTDPQVDELQPARPRIRVLTKTVEHVNYKTVSRAVAGPTVTVTRVVKKFESEQTLAPLSQIEMNVPLESGIDLGLTSVASSATSASEAVPTKVCEREDGGCEEEDEDEDEDNDDEDNDEDDEDDEDEDEEEKALTTTMQYSTRIVEPTTEPIPEPTPAPQEPVPEPQEPTPATTPQAEPTPEAPQEPIPEPQQPQEPIPQPQEHTPEPQQPQDDQEISVQGAPNPSPSGWVNPQSVSDIHLDALVYSPYNDDNSCKDAQTVRHDLYNIAGRQKIRSIRVYATDCNTVNTVLPVARELGMQVNQGFWMDASGPNSVDNQVDELIAWGRDNGWDLFSMILVANEAILSGYTDSWTLLAKISEVKDRLRAAGYNGPVSTAEPPALYMQRPELCHNDIIDFVGINSHPYFNLATSAQTAGQFVAAEINMIKDFCQGKRVYVTETGYPSQGTVNGGNVPTKENQKVAIASILEATNGDATFLTTYDDHWKQPGPYGIEQYFGILDII